LCVVKIPNDIFKQIEKYMPFSSVDIIILKDQKIILTKRSIPPYRGYWNLPGSVILKNEKMVATVKRSSKEELGIEVVNPTFIGNYETFTKFPLYYTSVCNKVQIWKNKIGFPKLSRHPSGPESYT
jgi:8-oxo-dGTP pyrophosphatase MutT (NUDIX family)